MKKEGTLLLKAMPKSVVWYERIAYTCVALGASTLLLTWSQTAYYLNKNPILYPLAIIFVFAAQIFWIWLVARKRQNWARWVSAGALVVGVPELISQFDERYRLDHIATIAYYSTFLLLALAVAMLFRPDAMEWFQNQKLKADREIAN